MVSLFRDRAWNHFRKGDVYTKYRVRAEYEIRLYSPLSYTAFCVDKSVVGKWHQLAYFIARVLNNLSGLFNNIYRVKRVSKLANNGRGRGRASKKEFSTYARAWLGIRNGAYHKKPANFFDRFAFASGRLSKVNMRRHKGLNNSRSNTASRRRSTIRAVALKCKWRRKFVRQYMIGLTSRSCALLFSGYNRFVRAKNIRKRKRKWANCYKVFSNLVVYSASRSACSGIMFFRSVLHVLCGAYYATYLRSISSICIRYAAFFVHWANIHSIIFVCGLLPKLRRRRPHLKKLRSKHKRRHTKKYKSSKRVYVLFFRNKSLLALNTIARYFYISFWRATNLVVLFLFHITYIFNAFTNEARSNISHITELFRQLSERKEHNTRISYMLSVLKISIRRALLHSSQILPLRKSFWSATKLCDFILLLASLDIDSHNISYRDIITTLMRGRYKKKAILDDIYKDNNMSKSWSNKRSSKATKYRKMSSVFGKVGILSAAFFDLSFFLKLNYDTDLYTFYSFCKLVCRGSMTLSTALWIYELTYTLFFNTYFISAIYSFNNFVFVNNVNYVDNRYRLVCIGDVIEVRAKSVFSDSFIILCNIIGQCKLSILKHFWLNAIISAIRPFFFFKKLIKKEQFVIFPKWNIFDSTSHYMIRPQMHYSYSKFRQLGVTAFKCKFFTKYINGLERTLHIFYLHLFKEAHFIWNISISFVICWRYNKKLRMSLYKNKIFCSISNIGHVMSDSLVRRVVYLQSKFAHYVFRKTAYCLADATRIRIEKPISGNWREGKDKKHIMHMFAAFWSCKLGKAEVGKRMLFSWNFDKPVAAFNKAIGVPNFMYRMYRSEYIKERLSFEKDTVDNALRYANIFIIFLFFFKYGQRSTLLRKAIKQQRRLIKVAIPLLRTELLNARKWTRAFWRRRNLRLQTMYRQSATFRKVRSVIRKKLVAQSSNAVDFADLSDWLTSHGKWPKHVKKSLRTPWWFTMVRRKPFWLYSISKPNRVITDMPWWSSVKPWRYYATRRKKKAYDYQKLWDVRWRFMRMRRLRRRLLRRGKGGSSQYIPWTFVLRRVWNKRRRKLRKRLYRFKKLRSKLYDLSYKISKHYNSYWYRTYRIKHNLDFLPMNVRKLNYSIRKALSFSLGSNYSSNLLGKRIVEPLLYSKLCKSLLSQLLKFASFGKSISRGRRNKYLYSKQYRGRGKSTRGIFKSYHTSSGKGNSFENLMANIIGKHLRDAKVKSKQNKERRKRDSVMNLSDILFKKKPAAVVKIRRANKKKVSSPFFFHFNRYIDESALFQLWDVLHYKSYRFSDKHIYNANNKKHRKFKLPLHDIKYKTKKWMAFGVQGSFYRDSKFLHFFVHKCKLHTIKQKMRSLLYIQLYKHIKLFKSYISRFTNTALFSRLKSKLFRLIINRYKYSRSKLVLNNKLQSTDLERFFTFFNILGKVHVQYVSQLRPVVKQCISYAQYAELSSKSTKLSYDRLNAPHWRYAKVRHNYRSALIHYFTKNMLLGPDMFTIYGNNVLVFSVRNTKLHLSADYYGNAINEFLLNRKIADFFPSSDKYTDLTDVK